MINICLVLIISIFLLFADYWLTLFSFNKYNKKFKKYIEYESFELNPRFKNTLKDANLINPQHLFGVILSSCYIIILYSFSLHNFLGFRPENFNLIATMLISALVLINLRHLQGLYIYKIIEKNKKSITGKIKYSYLFSLKSSLASASVVFILLLTGFLFYPSYKSLGFALGPLVHIAANLWWLRVYNKNL